MSAGQEVRFATVASGTRIAWGRTGRGPALVRAAHWMTNVEHDLRSAIWRPWIERISREVTFYRYDARGCGLSGKDDAPVTLDSALEELEAVVDSARLERFALLGISAGSATAIRYAARHPERVTHLVIVGGFARGLLHHDAPTAIEHLDALVRVMELGWGSSNPAIQQYFTTVMEPDATAEQAAAMTELQRLACDGARAAATMRLAAGIDVSSLLPSLTTPTFVLHAEADALVPVELGRELAAAIPGARFETLSTRNHVPLAGDVAFERLCEVVGSFVANRPTTPAFDATPRERDLLAAVARGLDNLQIAAELDLAEKTVRNALSKLYAKLGVEGRPQAIVRARELGFGQD
jgi:pimeloyl-ACP methyl ester carboxylesterase